MPDPVSFAIQWDAEGQRLYEVGVDRGVLFTKAASGYNPGVAWNGLTAVNENPSGGEPTALWADNMKYLNLLSTEEFGATIEAYTYPDEWAECDGSATITTGVYIGQQTRKPFGFAYRTLIGNDVDSQDHGYKIHLVYNATAKPSSKNYETVNDSPSAITFSYEISTTPVPVTNYKPTAHLVIDSTKADPDLLASFEQMLYGISGTNGSPATLPSPDEVIAHFTTTPSP